MFSQSNSYKRKSLKDLQKLKRKKMGKDRKMSDHIGEHMIHPCISILTFVVVYVFTILYPYFFYFSAQLIFKLRTQMLYI